MYLFGIMAVVSVAWATSFYPRPFPVTIQDAPVIVRGHINSTYSDWAVGPDNMRRLYTFYNVEVSEVLKGSATGPTLVMREMGGEKDGVGMEVAGAAHFQVGEDVVTLLSLPNSDGTYDVHGLMMGKMDVVKNDSGEEFLQGPALELNIHDENDVSQHSSQTWTLRNLRKLIATQAIQPTTSPVSKIDKATDSVSASPLGGASAGAPQLQTSGHTPALAPEQVPAPESRHPLWMAGAAVIVLLSGIQWWRRRRL
jgi:hypothetical protein